MSRGTFQEFLDAMRAFESGWDRARYDEGIIQDWQLDQWAGGPVEQFFPSYTSWSQLSDAEWDAMSYRSMNSFGFVGYQFGEAFLIDLGYYDDDFYYGNGAATNTWDGTWTGKNGVDSLEEFMTKEAQEVAIREAFGFNLQTIQTGLAQYGESLDDYLGTTRTYLDNGQTVEVTLTMTGILAAAHLRGAPAVLQLLRSGTVSADEFGTSILQYVEQFGGFDAPTIDESIAYFEDRLTGDEGLGTPGGGSGGGGGAGNGTAGVTKDTADVVITWTWGQDEVVNGFDPSADTIFIDWIDAARLEVSEVDGSVVFAVPSNNQTTTLTGVTLSMLSAANFTILDDTAAAEVLGLVGGDPGTGDGGDDPDAGGGDDPDAGGGDDPDAGGGDDPDAGGGDNPDAGGGDDPDVGDGGTPKTVTITWSWAQNEVVTDFDPARDSIFVDWISANDLEVGEVNGSAVFSLPSMQQSTTLQGVALADLSPSNFTVLDDTARAEIFAAIGPDDTGSGGGGHSDGHQMIMISLTSPSRTVTDFDPATDMVHIEQDVTADRFQIYEETSNTLGQTVRIVVTTPDGAPVSTTFIQGIGLADLTLSNFSIADQGVLNEVVGAIGGTISDPGSDGGYDIVYDSDGSDPPATTGTTAAGGVKYRADTGADDIVGFDPARDELDFGDTSVHGMIVTKTPAGEVAIDSPWTSAIQIVEGVGFDDLTINSFGIVGNEHFRQDIGGVLSWELGLGPREDDTVYIRSHEYGEHAVIDGFDPGTMKISFLYFGTRERLTVEDTDAGLVISSLPTGQSFTFTGLKLEDLSPGQVEFHFDQVMEDNLEAPFGFDQNDVTLVARTGLLTPEAPAGQTTDGHQTREGVWDAVVDIDPGDGDSSGGNGDGGDSGDGAGDGDSGGGDGGDGDDAGDGGSPGGVGEVDLTWRWGVVETIEGFDPDNDVLDFGNLSPSWIGITEEGGALVIEILNNGGHKYVLEDVQAEDLSSANLTAAAYNNVVDANGGVIDQLTLLGYDEPLI